MTIMVVKLDAHLVLRLKLLLMGYGHHLDRGHNEMNLLARAGCVEHRHGLWQLTDAGLAWLGP